METLKRINYPKADALNGADFDWLFDTVEDQSFLRWFCGNVKEQNVLSKEELQALSLLEKSGKPILEGAALEEALKTCQACDWKTPSLDDQDLEKLEDEVRMLQKVKQLQVQRRNKCQLLAAVRAHGSLGLGAKEAPAARGLSRSQGVLRAAAAEASAALQALGGGVARLMTLGHSHAGRGTEPTLFLSQLSLEKYLSQEEQSTAALTLYTKKHFFSGIPEVVESSNEENFQLLDMQAPSVHDDQALVEERRLEMARLRFAHICIQQQLIHLKASNWSMSSSIKWAEENLHSLPRQVVGEGNLDAKISSLKSEILQLEEEISHIKDQSLPALVKENAQLLLSMPVVKGDFDLQIAKQDYYTERQELVLNQLIKQKASFELLQLAFEVELRKHWDVYRQLESLAQGLSRSNSVLHQRLEMLKGPSAPEQINSRNTIDTKDYSTLRLYQLLEGENKKKELFVTHENLKKSAEKLKQDVSLVQSQLALSAQEHSFFLSKLNNDVDMLCDALYQGGNQLLLNDQELVEQFHQVESQLNKLNHLFTDILADVKTKRKILTSNKLHHMERNLYVYFLKDEDYLKEMVEDLENQSKIKAIDLED